MTTLEELVYTSAWKCVRVRLTLLPRITTKAEAWSPILLECHQHTFVRSTELSAKENGDFDRDDGGYVTIKSIPGASTTETEASISLGEKKINARLSPWAL
jgi:hypothetical protein